MEKVLAWRQPVNPHQQLDQILSHITCPIRSEIRTCVNIIASRSYEEDKKELQQQLKKEVDLNVNAMLLQIKAYIKASGVADEIEGLDAFIQTLVQGEMPITVTTGKRTAIEDEGSTNKKEKRMGGKIIQGRDGFRYWPAERKLQFVAANYDPNTGAYENGSRQFLLRTNPIANCFVNCCNSNVVTFLAKHAGGKADFSAKVLIKNRLSGCPNCFALLTRNL
jgi:hypothetical protein